MAITPMGQSDRGLREALRGIAQRRRREAWVRRLLSVACGWLLGLLALVVMDGMWELGTAARWMAWMALVGTGAAGLWWARPATEDGERAALHDAQRVERARRLAHHPLISALQLTGRPFAPGTMAGATHSDDAFARALVARAEARGRVALIGAQRAGGRGAGRGDWHGAKLRRAGGCLWAVVVVWMVATVIQPGAVGTGLARLAWPGTAQPAFSFTRLEAWANPGEPRRGDNVRVRAAAHGVVPTAAALVELDEAGRSVGRWPMGRIESAEAGDAVFERVLRNLREPVTYRVEAGGGRSALLRLEPREPERTDDEGTRAHDEARMTQRTEPDDLMTDDGRREEEASWAALAAALVELAQAAGALSAAADGMPAPADEMTMDQLGSLAQGIADFTDDAATLSEALRVRLAQMEAEGGAWAAAMLAALEGLRLPEMGAGAETAAAGEADRDAWLDAVREAAAADARALSPWAGEPVSGEGDGQQVTGAHTAEADDATPDGAAPAAGTYHHWVRAMREGGPEVEMLMTPVPAGYRELVGAYFYRLSVDERSRDARRADDE